MWSRVEGYELRLGGMQPSFHPSGDRYAVTTYVAPPGGNDLLVVESASDKSTVVFHQDGRSVLGPQWSPRGDGIVRHRQVWRVLQRVPRSVPEGRRPRRRGQIAMVNVTDRLRELTSGPNNNGFVAVARWAPFRLPRSGRTAGSAGDERRHEGGHDLARLRQLSSGSPRGI
jgi:hypothetical protein